MKKLLLVSVLFFVSACAQNPTVSPDISLRLVPHVLNTERLQSFTFTLTNESNHPMVLPEPILDCGGSYTGSIWIRYRRMTPGQVGEGMGWGCAADKYGWPSITNRVQQWKTLQPGQALRLEGDAQTLHLENLQAGMYDFWADYTPPVVTEEEARTLVQSGYQFSSKKLTSEHMRLKVSR